MTVFWEGDRFTESEGQLFLLHFQSALQLLSARKDVPSQVLRSPGAADK